MRDKAPKISTNEAMPADNGGIKMIKKMKTEILSFILH